MVEYNKVNVKLSDSQLNKPKSAVKNQTGMTYMSSDIKLSKAQISKIIQHGEFVGSLLSKIAASLMKVAVPIA